MRGELGATERGIPGWLCGRGKNDRQVVGRCGWGAACDSKLWRVRGVVSEWWRAIVHVLLERQVRNFVFKPV